MRTRERYHSIIQSLNNYQKKNPEYNDHPNPWKEMMELMYSKNQLGVQKQGLQGWIVTF